MTIIRTFSGRLGEFALDFDNMNMNFSIDGHEGGLQDDDPEDFIEYSFEVDDDG